MTNRFDVRHLTGFKTVALICLFVLYAPPIAVTIFSFNDSSTVSVWQGFSLRWYTDVFVGPEGGKFKMAAFNSFTIALISATVSTAITTLAATAIVRGGTFRGPTL